MKKRGFKTKLVGCVLLGLCLSLLSVGIGHTADVTLLWDPQTDADGFRVYQSVDQGATWTKVAEIMSPSATSIMVTAPDTGLVLFRISAYNAQGEAVRFDAGGWYNGDWKPPVNPRGTGIQ